MLTLGNRLWNLDLDKGGEDEEPAVMDKCDGIHSGV